MISGIINVVQRFRFDNCMYFMYNNSITEGDMITIAVCDDNATFGKDMEQRIRALCAGPISDNCEIKMLKAFDSCLDLLSFMDEHPVSILFLDVDMPELSGFEAAEQICRKQPDTKIIFVSSYDDFVYTSFEYNPFRFIRKSRLDIELPDALIKAVKKCTSDKESAVFDTVNGKQAIMFSEIVYLSSEGNYYYVNTLSGAKYKCRGSLNDAEKKLARPDFFRIQQSFIVNMNHVVSVKRGEVELKGREILTVSRRKKESFNSAYLEFSRKRF